MAYFSPAARSGPDPVDFIHSATGALVPVPEGFNNYAVDPLTGESSFLWPSSETSQSEKPGIIVPSQNNTYVLDLDAQKTAAAGVQDVLAVWNGLIWIDSSAGIDVVVASTGAGAPSISGGEVYRVPGYA